MIKKLSIDRRDFTNQQIEDKINDIIDEVNKHIYPTESQLMGKED